MIKYSVAFWALRKYLRRLTQRRHIIRVGGNEWERKWQVAGKCCNINRTDPYAGEDQTEQVWFIPTYLSTYLYIWRLGVESSPIFLAWHWGLNFLLAYYLSQMWPYQRSLHLQRETFWESPYLYVIYLAVSAIFAALRPLLYSILLGSRTLVPECYHIVQA